jgi:indole-3-glycerol phosphate synthase
VILDRILRSKRAEVAAAKREAPIEGLRERSGWKERRRGFAEAIRRAEGRRIIAEIKKASPSRGLIREDFDPARHAAEYERAGAVCLSVLTDTPFFQGRLADLEAARQAASIPLLRKDFVIDRYQLAEARAHGADAVLLIVAALDPTELGDLLAAAVEEGLDALVEVHDASELAVALDAGADLVGINNRDLKTFEVSTDVTRHLMVSMPSHVTVVSESGLGDATELKDLQHLGVHAFLIGETLMAAERPGDRLAALLSA